MSIIDLSMPDLSAPVIAITPAAIKQVKYLIEKKGDPNVGLRVGVRGGGCSGLSYFLALEAEPRESDLTQETDGIKVFVDRKSARFLKGATLDYSLKNILEGGFVFHNPNASRTCGCGTSFQPKAQ